MKNLLRKISIVEKYYNITISTKNDFGLYRAELFDFNQSEFGFISIECSSFKQLIESCMAEISLYIYFKNLYY